MNFGKMFKVLIFLLAAVTPIISNKLDQNKTDWNKVNKTTVNISKPQIDEFYIKVAIFADHSMTKHYGNKLHRYLNVIMKKVARMFRQPTIGNISFNFAVPEIVELNKVPKNTKNFKQFSPQYTNLTDEFGKWRYDQILNSWPSIMNNHVSVLITRENIFSTQENPTAIILSSDSLIGGIGHLVSSYFVVKDFGYRSAAIIAQELGRLIGVVPDSESSDLTSFMSNNVGFILSGKWSEEARNQLTILQKRGALERFRLKNNEKHPPLIPTDGPEYWASESSTRAEQCELQYGYDNKYSPGTLRETLESCEFLRCGHNQYGSFVEAPNWFAYNPIEDGTLCVTKEARGGICLDNQCVETECYI